MTISPVASTFVLDGQHVSKTALRTWMLQVETDVGAPGAGLETLTAGRTYYVRTDGNDSNSGLVNNAGGAFLTLQGAYNKIQSTVYPAGNLVTVQVGNGTYSAGVQDTQRPYPGRVFFRGDPATPTNVTIDVSVAGDDCFLTGQTEFIVSGFYMKGNGSALHAARNGTIFCDAGNRFGAVLEHHFFADNMGKIVATNAYTIDGGGQSHYYQHTNGWLGIGGITVTCLSTPAFSTGFAVSTIEGSIEAAGITFSGACTGRRFFVDRGGNLYTGFAGFNYFPGNTEGVLASGYYDDISADDIQIENPNLIINGDFQINQRVFAGGLLSAGAYGHDRWKAGGGNANYTISGYVVTLASGSISQVVELECFGLATLASQSVTISVDTPSADMTVVFGTQSGTITAGSGRRSVTLTLGGGDTGNRTLTLSKASGSGVTFGRVKVEQGSIATRWVARAATDEWELCRRYFQSFRNDTASPAVLTLVYGHTTTTRVFSMLPLPTRLRAFPTVTFNGLNISTISATIGAVLDVNFYSSASLVVATLDITHNGASTAGATYTLLLSGGTGNYLDFSCEL